MKTRQVSRRSFLQIAALSLGSVGADSRVADQSAGGKTISLLIDPADRAASTAPVIWAHQELEQALAEQGLAVRRFHAMEQVPREDLCIVVSASNTQAVSAIFKQAGVAAPLAPESLALAPSMHQGRSLLVTCGADSRGLTYALLELADRVRHSDDPLRALRIKEPISETPFNPVRSIGRLFSSDAEDKAWFNDREMWPAYFSMLATQRFNCFSLNLGIGYDSLQHVKDSYFLFVYPFFLSVPGYQVRATNLPDAERDRNLEMLQFISSQAVAHGIDFQLGIWTHGYEWIDSPHPNHNIEGITRDNHAAYSRDALRLLLEKCPAISGVTLRTHGESGVREGSYAFWKTVFEGVRQPGRKVRIDLHTKGLDQRMIDSALATGMQLRLSPKYWAEHMGLPYHQAAIRELEMPRENAGAQDFYSLSTGSRIFTRYGYADFLSEDRPYEVMHRIWPGTHRFLLWGDPLSAAAYARAFTFCGSVGVELYEPLSFKGRRGSGLAGGRCAYVDASLNPRWDWEKYLYTYRVWGRLLYNPDADSDTWRRFLRKRFAGDADALGSALASATRIVPIVTTAHLPSAANDTFGPEFYTCQPMVDSGQYSPYGDTPAPKVFANVSPLDPQLFSRISDFVREMLQSEPSGKHSPIEVAQWLEDLAGDAAAHLASAGSHVGKSRAEFRRMTADIKIQIGLGRFFAALFRSGVLYAIHEQSGYRGALEASLATYTGARGIWSRFAERARGIYVSDITYGPRADERGHWLDRLPAIDGDIAAMANRLKSLPDANEPTAQVRAAIQAALGRPMRSSMACSHTAHPRFIRAEPLDITLSIKEPAAQTSVRLYYRQVNQSQRYEVADMQSRNREYRATIPASYTNSKYPLQYYFELKEGRDKAWLYPGFAADLANQPYFVVRSAA